MMCFFFSDTVSSLDTLCSAVMDAVAESFVKVLEPCFYNSITVVKLCPKNGKTYVIMLIHSTTVTLLIFTIFLFH